MNRCMRLVGEATGVFATVAERLRHESFAIVTDVEASAPDLLINLAADADRAIAAASGFADIAAVDSRERLMISIWPVASLGDWEACRTAAAMTAFTRYAALAWATTGIRVNAVTIATPTQGIAREGVAADVVALVLALRRWRSMTGQIIELTM